MQALIQVAAACHHLQKGTAAGAASLLRRVLQRLECCPASFGGIDVVSLRADVSEGLRLLESGKSAPATAPRICPTEIGPT